MPDWSYHTLFRPLLFRLPAIQARRWTLNAIGALAKCPGGPGLIELMGHMQPPASLQRERLGITFPTPVGLGAGLDPNATALAALSQFGFGYIELGPVTKEPICEERSIERLTSHSSILYPTPMANGGVELLLERLNRMKPIRLPLGARLAFRPGSSPREAAVERRELIERLAPYCQFFTLDTREQTPAAGWDAEGWQEHLALLAGAARVPLLLAMPPDLTWEEAEGWLKPAFQAGIAGVSVSGGISASAGVSAGTPPFQAVAGRGQNPPPPSARIVGGLTREMSLSMVRQIRDHYPDLPIMASGGVTHPSDAQALLSAGADFVQLHSGLVYAGPGLPKRVNEAIWHEQHRQRESEIGQAGSDVTRDGANPSPPSDTASRDKAGEKKGWIAGKWLGFGMMAGGLLALIVALTTVVLPYDEDFLGMSSAELALINPQLLPFMSHDRVSLAGTMISIGLIYYQLSQHGLRRSLHWTRQVLLISGAIGFLSFFLFIGYGYFDILHAVLAALLLPFFVLAMRQPAREPLVPSSPQVHRDGVWRRSLWGQLFFVIIGCGLTGAGLIISAIGVTMVFVPQDLAFLCASPELLQSYNERLIPLIAHDRAGFGGALCSAGLAVLLISLWGFRQGDAWVWWTLFLGGVPGFASGIGIHFAVGYTDFVHLLPAYAGALLFLAALALTYPYFCWKS